MLQPVFHTFPVESERELGGVAISRSGSFCGLQEEGNRRAAYRTCLVVGEVDSIVVRNKYVLLLRLNKPVMPKNIDNIAGKTL